MYVEDHLRRHNVLSCNSCRHSKTSELKTHSCWLSCQHRPAGQSSFQAQVMKAIDGRCSPESKWKTARNHGCYLVYTASESANYKLQNPIQISLPDSELAPVLSDDIIPHGRNAAAVMMLPPLASLFSSSRGNSSNPVWSIATACIAFGPVNCSLYVANTSSTYIQ